MRETEFLIIGGGPTGLGAACRLEERGRDWHLLDRESYFGGLACSWVDDAGFTWDLGGHVQFSHYDTFDKYMDLALGVDGWLTHERESWVWIDGRFVPYPFQNNLHRLEKEDVWDCVQGLLGAKDRLEKLSAEGKKPQHFGEWMEWTFGEGITRVFMRPYNKKVWAYEPCEMDYRWIGERVAVPDITRVLKGICLGEDDVSWGPNATFRFPVRGGTGSVWQAIGGRLPEERISLGTEVAKIDAEKHEVHTVGGDVVRYKHLISSIPMDLLADRTEGVPGAERAGELLYSSTTVVGVGIEGDPPEHLETKCWMYFPMANSPYYRVTVFSNYSPNNVARPGEQWSLMAEIATPRTETADVGKLEEWTVKALKEDQLLPEGSEVVSVVSRHLPRGYPTPMVGRDDVADPTLRAFEAHDIWSRGRFGAWKYEVSNQDHSFAQGYECVERLIQSGGEELEPTLFTPGVVNSQRNP